MCKGQRNGWRQSSASTWEQWRAASGKGWLWASRWSSSFTVCFLLSDLSPGRLALKASLLARLSRESLAEPECLVGCALYAVLMQSCLRHNCGLFVGVNNQVSFKR